MSSNPPNPPPHPLCTARQAVDGDGGKSEASFGNYPLFLLGPNTFKSSLTVFGRSDCNCVSGRVGGVYAKPPRASQELAVSPRRLALVSCFASCEDSHLLRFLPRAGRSLGRTPSDPFSLVQQAWPDFLFEIQLCAFIIPLITQPLDLFLTVGITAGIFPKHPNPSSEHLLLLPA